MTRSADTARRWATARGITRYVWPITAGMVTLDPRVELVMLPDWGLHPDSRALAERFHQRLDRRRSSVLN